jgi:hypothetical protein
VVSHPGPSSFPLGTTPVAYTAHDDAGNQAGCSTSVTVQDTTPPMITCPRPTVAECTGNGHALVDPGDATATDACTTGTANHPGPSSFPLGTTPVAYTTHDDAGNQAGCSTSVTVQDTTPPAITCPSPIVAECTGHSGAFVSPGQAVSSDICTDATVTVPVPGVFPLGTTVVTYTSNDQAGNQSSCTSTIKVVDTTPPQVIVERTLALWPPNHQYRTVSLDDCGIEIKDSCGGQLDPSTFHAAITCVTSDEPDDEHGHGDGDATQDIVIINDTMVKLRAERDGDHAGRTYKIHFQVRDESGNRGDGMCSVIVPHDQGCARSPTQQECRIDDRPVENSVCTR